MRESTVLREKTMSRRLLLSATSVSVGVSELRGTGAMKRPWPGKSVKQSLREPAPSTANPRQNK